ncbi:MAG TPA: ribulose-phosphate 3-epimerase [Balneolaceae bacterium]|nr:ribulose-phosphate 3-epimerase [Balneolaceae bacterium]
MNNTFPLLAPSILAADFGRLDEQIKICVDEGIKWIHCDIMDGHFVPNISYGADIVKVAGRSDSFLDVHLMIENPDYYIEQFAQAGANLLCVHQETCSHLHRTIQHIKEFDVKAGVAINPATSLHTIVPILNEVDLVLVMSVNPGFGGQKFIESSYERIEKLASVRNEKKLDFLIEVDGGIGSKNIKKVVQHGADVLVAGSSVFKSDNIAARIQKLTSKLTNSKNLELSQNN